MAKENLSHVDMAGSDPGVLLAEAQIKVLTAIRAALAKHRRLDSDPEVIRKLNGGDEIGTREEKVS